MKSFMPVVLFLCTTPALAHPGHGRPGLLHFHEFADGLAILIGLVVAGLVCWAWTRGGR